MADRGEDFLIQEVPKDKNTITLCKAGLRAYEAQTTLAGSGVKDVRVMDGGMEGWPYERFMENRESWIGPGFQSLFTLQLIMASGIL